MAHQTSPPTGIGRVVALNGSPSRSSRTRTLAEAALAHAGGGELVDLAELDATALLGLADDAEVARTVELVSGAAVLVVATPIYRATYTALTKTIFDLCPQGALAGTVTVPVATGFGAHHALSIDHGLRPLIASLDGLTTARSVYATSSDFDEDGQPTAKTLDALHGAIDEALALSVALAGSATAP